MQFFPLALSCGLGNVNVSKVANIHPSNTSVKFNPLETEDVRIRRERTDKTLIILGTLVLIFAGAVLAYIWSNPVAGL